MAETQETQIIKPLFFPNKYISVDLKEKEPTSEKTVLSNDAYALGEMLQELIAELRRATTRGVF